MSDNEGGGDGKTTTAFFLGFLLGVLLTLGAGGTYGMIQVQRARAEAAMQAEQAARAAMEAEEARRRAEAERARTEKALQDARRAAPKKGE